MNETVAMTLSLPDEVSVSTLSCDDYDPSTLDQPHIPLLETNPRCSIDIISSSDSNASAEAVGSAENAPIEEKSFHPWGYYQVLHRGERFQVKCLSVIPGCQLSLQKHFHRAERWVIVNGTALVTCNNENLLLSENDSIYLPLGAVHRLENPGRIPLNLIEVQSGETLEEDDIIRIEDAYERVP